jgi:hypothetical protein
MRHRNRRRGAVLLGIAFIAGCRTAPTARVGDAPAVLATGEVAGLGFSHQLLVAGAGGADAPQFVFLEGDGRPWSEDGRAPASDPDPLRPLARDLAAATGGGALALGRPCYHGRAADPGCRPELWTSGRYSEPVVDSMVAALGHALDAGPRRPLVLVGYSGGGALALLIADRVAAVKAVVTLAANLDLAGWTELHGYEALTDSLDPLSVRRLPTGCEIHIAAAHDSVVPPSLVRNAVARRPGALLWVESGDHACCWADRWPGIERRVVARLDAAGCLAAN